MRKVFTVIIVFIFSINIFADWGLWDSQRSYIVLNIKGTSTTYSLWDAGTGTFQGTDLGTFTAGDVFEINNVDVKTWKNGTGDVTGCEYFYVIYETGARPSSPNFTSLGGGWLENLDNNGNQKWGVANINVDLLSGLEPSKNYTLEIYGRVDGNNPSTSKYDNNNNSSTNYTATFSTDAGLPVELITFQAFTANNKIELKWETATEVNNYGFEIERAEDSNQINWEKIGFVEGNGNSNSPKQYTFVDNSVLSGKYFYRLKQIDIDGSFEYSNIIEIDLSMVTEFNLAQNYPNPFNPNTIIKYSIPQLETLHANSQQVQLKIYDILGREIATLVNEKQSPGNYEVTFDAVGLPTGIYFYKLTAGSFTDVKKMILMK